MSPLAVSAAIRDDGLGTADQLVRVVWTWSGFLSGSETQNLPYQGPEWRSPTVGNIAYNGTPTNGGAFTFTATAFDVNGQSTTLTSGTVVVTPCSAPWIMRVYGTPDPVAMARPTNGGFCTGQQPETNELFAVAEINTHGGVDFPTEVIVEWRLDVDGAVGKGTMGSIANVWGFTLPPFTWTDARDKGGKIQLTVRLYDRFGLVQTALGAATLAPCNIDFLR